MSVLLENIFSSFSRSLICTCVLNYHVQDSISRTGVVDGEEENPDST